MAGFGMGARNLESEMVKHGVQILTVQQPSQAENAYRKLLASLTGERKFVGVDCEGINGDKLALMVQVRGYSLFIFLVGLPLHQSIVIARVQTGMQLFNLIFTMQFWHLCTTPILGGVAFNSRD